MPLSEIGRDARRSIVGAAGHEGHCRAVTTIVNDDSQGPAGFSEEDL